MRIFHAIVLFTLLSAGNCLSQDQPDPFYIDTLTNNGVLLNKGWKFHAGDNPEYANPLFDDKDWQTVNPTLDIQDLPAITKTGICWLRLHLQIDTLLLTRQLALIINQATASEIYLNGRLIYRFGKLATNPKEVVAFDPLSKPVALPLDRNPKQMLAARYAFQPDISYTDIWGRTNPLLKVRVNELHLAFDEYRYQRGFATSIIFRIGIYLILAILHLAFFLYYPSQKANLYFSLFAFFGLGGLFELNLPNEVMGIYYFSNLTLILAGCSFFFLLTAIYSLFEQKRGWIYWGLSVAIITGMFLNGWSYPSRWMIGTTLITTLVNVEIVRIAFKALRFRKKGAWTIATGGIIYLVFLIAFVIGVTRNLIGHLISANYTIADLLFNISVLSMPVAISIYLGLDFAFTSYALKQKLKEVEQLSTEAIAHEKEKQQILSSQKEILEKEVEERTSELSQSLKDLKETQSQLVQREKMASLGELTAGIAHEIQNPLNFVNNFSDVSNELLEEMKGELATGNMQQAIALADDVRQNLEKILHHGKRADGIVKGMLQHSRSSSGVKEPTDINALADEYLRLVYHGLRAKDKSFNAKFETNFDNSIGKINIIPQDIGRVLVNLINNAFYACTELSRSTASLPSPENIGTGAGGISEPVSNKIPTVWISTKKENNKVLISVRDNGPGIPANILDKIYQPFFTTKPTGQGTGLGLSLAYDIVKAHGGELKVETPPAGRAGKEGEGSEFIIQIPVNKAE